ncbi:MAG: polyphosphate polymerase domain-containing protein [Lachnospiraceae bacterium]|jgi:hypothetical protein
MAIEIFNRTEEKYLLTERQTAKLLEMSEGRIKPDPYCVNGRKYLVENIYYDSANDDMINRAIEKHIYREKMRVRSYGIPASDGTVFLEIKKKYNGNGNKRRTGMPLPVAKEYLEKGKMPDPDTPGINIQVFKEIDYMRKIYGLTPKTMITYERQAWFSETDPGLRLTFDRNILAREDNLDLQAGPGGRSILPRGKVLFELKAEGAVPLWLVNAMSQMRIWPVTFSKYAREYVSRDPEELRVVV